MSFDLDLNISPKRIDCACDFWNCLSSLFMLDSLRTYSRCVCVHLALLLIICIGCPFFGVLFVNIMLVSYLLFWVFYVLIDLEKLFIIFLCMEPILFLSTLCYDVMLSIKYSWN